MKVTEDQIKDLIVEICGIDRKKIVPEATFKEGLQMDSLNIADLMSSLEEDYDIIVKQEDILHIKTFGDLSNYLKTL